MTSNILPSPSIQMARSLQTISLTTTPSTTSTNTTSGSTTVSPKIPDTIDSYQLFQYQMECGNTESAVDAMKRLYVVCILHGSTFTAQHIIPYLTNLITLAQQQPSITSSGATSSSSPATTSPGTLVAANTLSDEMLLLLGQQLLLILQHVTTSPADTIVYTTLMERLCSVEETVVRDQAVVVTQFILQRFATMTGSGGDSKKIAADMLPIWFNVTKRLQSADWFTSKVSCAGILPFVLQLANTVATGGNTITTSSPPPPPTSQQIQIIALYRDLCMDETPMVRRAAAKHLGTFLLYAATICTPPPATSTTSSTTPTDATTVGYEDFASTQVIALCHDEQDSVRLLAVASLAQAGTYYGTHNPSFTIQYWIPIVRDGATDLSWYVVVFTFL
jgi:serine/threonine-protein phosphatase 2A regulatory subunit A